MANSENQVINNIFNGGLSNDIHPYMTPLDVYTIGQNVTFISHTGNEIILKNDKGTIFNTTIKPNYFPVDVKEFNGIAYILSAEFTGTGLNRVFTGRGELGTFPSPNYNTYTLVECQGPESVATCSRVGQMEMNYKPLKNYRGDLNIPLNPPTGTLFGDFNSSFFNFRHTDPIHIVAVQASYDDSVNIIITDYYNRPRIINSGFSILMNKLNNETQYKIVNRFSTTSSNFYTNESWTTQLSQILTSRSLEWINFISQAPNGKLLTGTYKYYIKYETQDGTSTDVVASSFNIPVYIGDSVASIIGGSVNEESNKSNIIAIENVSLSYYAVRLYFTYTSGDSGSNPIVTSYKVETPYLLSGNSQLSINHTGFENTTPIGNDTLSLNNSDVYTYRTGVEAQGRLFIGNIKQNTVNYNDLRTYSAQVQVSYEQERLAVRGVGQNPTIADIHTALTNGQTNDGFDGGYYNPKNVHDKLGYYPGEAYSFCIQYIMKDGSRSPLFPMRGSDELLSDTTYNLATNLFTVGNEFDAFNNYENSIGYYRFPDRYRLAPILETGTIGIVAAKFTFPVLPSYIQNNTNGFKIYRNCLRRKDSLGSGIIMNTMAIPNIDYDRIVGTASEGDENQERLVDYNADNGGYNDSNSKWIPSPNFTLESAGAWGVKDSPSGEIARTPDLDSQSVELVKFFGQNYPSPSNAYVNNQALTRFAFISPEFITDNINSSNRMSGKNKSFKVYSKTNSLYGNSQQNEYSQLPNDTGLYTTVTQVGSTNVLRGPTQSIALNSEFIREANSNASQNGFSSQALFQSASTIQNGNALIKDRVRYSWHPLKYNDYVSFKSVLNYILTDFSVVLPTVVLDYAGIFLNSKVANDRYHNFTHNLTKFTGNEPNNEWFAYGALYNNQGPLATSIQITGHLPEFLTYEPVSHNTYWSQANVTETNGSMLSLILAPSRVLKAHNGDNYVSIVFRRLYYNSGDIKVVDDDIWQQINIGPTISFASDSNYNVAFRHEQVRDVTETIRSFYPYLSSLSPAISTYLGSSPWRLSRVLETTNFNTGYGSYESGLITPGFNYRLPFLQSNFKTRVYFSDIHVPGSFANGYQQFNLPDYRDYTSQYGQIISLNKINESLLLVVFENGLVGLPINQRIGGLNDSAGEVFFESVGVLPAINNVMTISSIYGSTNQFSIIKSDNYIYGVDVTNGKVWKLSESSFDLISDFKIQANIKKATDSLINKTESKMVYNIKSYYNKYRTDVGFVINNELLSYHVVYNEARGGLWQNEPTFIPNQAFTIRGDFYSFGGLTPGNIWEHYVNPKYNFVYDTQLNTTIEFVASINLFTQLIFDNLNIVSNHVYPSSILYTNDNESSLQTSFPRNIVAQAAIPYYTDPLNSTFAFDCVYREDKLYVTCIKNSSDSRGGLNNRRIRDKYCKIRITYNTDQELFIRNIVSFVRQSF